MCGLYLVLVTMGDEQCLSYYADATLAQLLSCSETALAQARRDLLAVGGEREEVCESVQAVNGRGVVKLSRDGELREEGRDLFVQRSAALPGEAGIVGAGGIEDPAVEAYLADAGARIGEEAGAEVGKPVSWAGCAFIPGMDTEGGEDERVGGSEGGDARPVGRVSAVDNHATVAAGEFEPGGGDAAEMRSQGLVLEVVMGVVQGHRGRVLPRKDAEVCK